MKKFWKKTEGFTLVELIVVIAILGILAGVGTVGYSGYIKKANMAADEQLVRDVAMALELGTYAGTNTESGYVILSTTEVPSVSGKTASSDKIIACLTSTFGDDLSGLLLKNDWNEDYNKSVFAGKESTVLGQIDNLTDTLNVVIENSNENDFKNFKGYLAENNVTDSAQKADAALLYVAKNTTALTPEAEKQYLDTVSTLYGENMLDKIDAIMGSYGGGQSVAGLAAIYAIAEGYCLYDQQVNGDSASLDTLHAMFNDEEPESVGEALEQLTATIGTLAADPNKEGLFQQYVESGTALQDAKAYLNIMDTVNAGNKQILDQIKASTAEAPFSYASDTVMDLVNKVKDGAVYISVDVSNGGIVVQTPLNN